MTPWPGWIRYTLLAVLFAVVGIGLVVALYDKGILPIAGPFVLLFLLPLLIPLRNRGLRNRSRRLAGRVEEELGGLVPEIDRERSLAPHERASGATDESLASAATRVAAARQQLAAGQAPAAVRTLEELERAATASWEPSAPLTRDAVRTAGTARKLQQVLRQAGRDEVR